MKRLKPTALLVCTTAWLFRQYLAQRIELGSLKRERDEWKRAYNQLAVWHRLR